MKHHNIRCLYIDISDMPLSKLYDLIQTTFGLSWMDATDYDSYTAPGGACTLATVEEIRDDISIVRTAVIEEDECPCPNCPGHSNEDKPNE